MREFLARVKAQLRRVRLIREEIDAEPLHTREALHFGNLTMNLIRREALLNNKPISLKPKEYDLLLYLARHRGQVLSRDQILEQVWGWTYSGGSRTVDVHIRWLRKKIEVDPTNPQRIITVRSAGYRFEG
jgi:DNA-binding response OmpR family regulator